MKAADLISLSRRIFKTPRPEHFTNFGHCEECAEHDATLRRYDPESIPAEALTNPGWDPLCFVSEEGFKYYFPALARLSLTGQGSEFYVDQLLFHLTYEGAANRHLRSFGAEQRQFVVDLLEAIQRERSEEVRSCMLVERLQQATQLWKLAGPAGG